MVGSCSPRWFIFFQFFFFCKQLCFNNIAYMVCTCITYIYICIKLYLQCTFWLIYGKASGWYLQCIHQKIVNSPWLAGLIVDLVPENYGKQVLGGGAFNCALGLGQCWPEVSWGLGGRAWLPPFLGTNIPWCWVHAVDFALTNASSSWKCEWIYGHCSIEAVSQGSSKGLRHWSSRRLSILTPWSLTDATEMSVSSIWRLKTLVEFSKTIAGWTMDHEWRCIDLFERSFEHEGFLLSLS